MKEFIRKYVLRGNNIINDGFNVYNFLEDNNSDYRHFRHIHGDILDSDNNPPST